MKHDWLLFDYDDTLGGVEIDGEIVPCHRAYHVVKERFAAQMVAYGFNKAETLATHEDIDHHAAHVHGFADKTRFARSMVATYEALSAKANRKTTAHNMVQIFEVGMEVFDFPYHALDGALDVLREVKRHYHLAVITKGETEEQHRKLTESGVRPFLDAAFVVSHKHAEDWAGVLARIAISPSSFATSWAIGNSIKADVNPLLRLGMNGIHLRDSAQWVFEHAEYETPINGCVLNLIDDIREVPAVLKCHQITLVGSN